MDVCVCACAPLFSPSWNPSRRRSDAEIDHVRPLLPSDFLLAHLSRYLMLEIPEPETGREGRGNVYVRMSDHSRIGLY